MTDFDLTPTLGLDVKAVNVVDVLLVAAAEDDELIIIHNRSGMAPTSTRYILTSDDLDALDGL